MFDYWGKKKSLANRFHPTTPLIRVSEHDFITQSELCEGVSIFGATGGGKTSGPGNLLARACLKAGYGFLVLTAKVDEYARWEKLCREMGRSGDLVRFGFGSPSKIDLLQYALSMPGGSVESAAQLLDILLDVGTRTGSTTGGERFWVLFAQKILRYGIAIPLLGQGKATLQDVNRTILSLPQNREEGASVEWATGSFAGRCLSMAADRMKAGELSSAEIRMLDQCGEFVDEMSALSDKTRTCGITETTTMLAKFLFGEISDLIASGETNLDLARIGTHGMILGVDIPVLRWREPGRFVQLILKALVQRIAVQRDPIANLRPIVVWMDEAQFFIAPSVDCMVQSVARQARLMTVMMTQSIPLMTQELGGSPKAEQEVQALLANLQNKFICQNICPTTNTAFSNLCGEFRETMYSGSSQLGDFDLISHMLGGEAKATASYSEQYRPQFPAWQFNHLAKGGPAFNNIVEAVVMQGGRTWSNGQTWMVSKFRQ